MRDNIQGCPPAVLARFQQHRLGDIGLSSVAAAELAFGVAKSGSARNRQALEMFLAPLAVLPFDEAAVWAYGTLRADLERRGTPIGAPSAPSTRCSPRTPSASSRCW